MKIAACIFWIMLTFVLCLLPADVYEGRGSTAARSRGSTEAQVHPVLSPNNSGAKTVGPIAAWYTRSSHERQWAAHFVLSCGIAWSLASLQLNHRRAFLYAFCGTVLIAFLVEGAQVLLPDSFGRSFSWDDIVAALSGATTGAAGCCISCIVGISGRKRGP